MGLDGTGATPSCCMEGRRNKMGVSFHDKAIKHEAQLPVYFGLVPLTIFSIYGHSPVACFLL